MAQQEVRQWGNGTSQARLSFQTPTATPTATSTPTLTQAHQLAALLDGYSVVYKAVNPIPAPADPNATATEEEDDEDNI